MSQTNAPQPKKFSVKDYRALTNDQRKEFREDELNKLRLRLSKELDHYAPEVRALIKSNWQGNAKLCNQIKKL